MMTVEQSRFFGLVTASLSEYVKVPTQLELDAWWGTCRVFSLADVEMALKAHAMDPDDGKRAPRPIDLKRRLSTPRRSEHGEGPQFRTSPEHDARMEKYRLDCIRSPSVVNTAHAIALRHGNRPWQSRAPFPLPQRRNEDAE